MLWLVLSLLALCVEVRICFVPMTKNRSDALFLELWDICFYPVLISTPSVNKLTLPFDYVSTCCESQIYGCEILNVVCVIKP